MSSHLQSNLSSALVESVIFQQNNSTIRVAFVSPLFAAFLRVDLIERFECERGRIGRIGGEDWWRTGEEEEEEAEKWWMKKLPDQRGGIQRNRTKKNESGWQN